VVLFPMNQRAEDLMMGAPSEVLPKAIARAAYPGGQTGLSRLGTTSATLASLRPNLHEAVFPI
jgi:hypothetical protein